MQKANTHILGSTIDDAWEIVFDQGHGFIGRVMHEDDRSVSVTLDPVFSYVSNPNIQQDQRTGNVGVAGVTRFAMPLEFMSSSVPLVVKWTRRYRLFDFDTEDRAVFESVVQGAMDMAEKIRAARAGVLIVPGMPGNLPKLPGVRS